MDKNATPARISCNEKVKKYTIATMERLGISCTLAKFYETLMAGKTVKTRHNAAALSLLQELTEKIDGFIPPVPTSNSDVKKIKQFLAKWKEKVTHLNEDMNTSTSSPVYLRDQVNVLLQQKKCNVQCSNHHLEWFLLRYGAEAMTPDKIASAIIQHSETDWNNLKTPIKDDEYHPHLTENTKERRQSFREKVEFIYDFVYSFDIDALTKKLQNDLDVISDLQKWQKETPRTYEYAERYQSLLDRLQTAPKFKLIKNPVLPAATKQEDTSEKSKANVEETMKESAASSEQVLLHQQQPDRENRNERPDQPDNGKDDTQPKGDYTLTQEEIWAINKGMLQEYLDSLSRNDSEAQRRIKEASAEIDYFSMMENFDDLFDELKRSVQNYQRPFKGGWAIGIIRNKVAADKSHHQQANP